MGPKISPRRLSLNFSPFNKEQVSWIILKFGELGTIAPVKRAFGTKFYRGHPRKVPRFLAFKRLIDRFCSSGHTRPLSPPGKPVTTENDIASVKAFFEANEKAHLRQAGRELGMSMSKVWNILRNKLKWKAFRQHRSQVLSDQHKVKRLSACKWFVNMGVEFCQDKVIYGDEKYFVLKQGPNRQNDRYWAPVNPHELVETKDQGGKKAMCWVGLVEGKVIGPVWFEGNMNGEVYKVGVLDHVWNKVKGQATRKGYYFMQDGASSHTTNANLEFLLSKFQGRVISNKTNIIWPPKSPDMNPLDFFLWGHSMSHIYRCQPRTLTDLKDMVGDFCQELDPDLVKKVCRSVFTRAKICIQQKGGHFEHIKKSAQKELGY